MNHARWDLELVGMLADLASPANPSRATLAHLRRGLGASLDYPLSRVGWLFCRVPDTQLEDAVLAAGLFAWAKGDCPHQPGGNDFGAAFGSGLTLACIAHRVVRQEGTRAGRRTRQQGRHQSSAVAV